MQLVDKPDNWLSGGWGIIPNVVKNKRSVVKPLTGESVVDEADQVSDTDVDQPAGDDKAQNFDDDHGG